MLNKKVYGIVEASILSDRNLKEEDITEIKIAKNFIELTVEDKGDKIKIKRGTKENLNTYWNITMMNNEHIKEFTQIHLITFTDFRKEFEALTKNITGKLDLEECVDEALKNLADKKVTSNIPRSDKRHNSNKKAAEIHGEDKIADSEDAEEEFLSEEEKKEIEGKGEYTEEEKKELIINLIIEKGEYKYKVAEISEITGIEMSEITEITLGLVEENKIKMKKKGKSGKNGIYGSLLEVVTEA
jgi:hypothetical protein